MIKKLASHIKQYKKDVIITPVFVTLEALLEVLIPFMMSKLIDDGINKGNMNVVWKLGIILVVFAMLSLVAGTFAGNYAAIASSGYAKNLRKDMYYSVQGFSFSNIDRFSTASLITRLTTDVTNVQMAFQMIIRIAIRSPLMLIFSLIMVFTINPKLSLIYIFVIPFLGIGLYVIIMHVHPIFQRVFRTYDKLNNVVQENLNGIRVVKSYVREEHETEKFEKFQPGFTMILQRLKK